MSDDYCYVDFFHKPDESKGEPRLPWTRMLRSEVPAQCAAYDWKDCYTTIQSYAFPKAVVDDSGEPHMAPVFADFDSDDLLASQRDMQIFVRWAMEEMGLDEADVRIWYSGKKGFHVLLNPACFGATPDPRLTYVYKHMFAHLKAYLKIATLDTVVYSKRRMWRVENSKHGSTGLYKVRLDHDQITESSEGLADIARRPGPKMEPWAERSSTAACDFLNRFWKQLEVAEAAAAHTPVALNILNAPGDPVCVQDIEGNGLKKPGDRNKATVVLATYYKDAGRSEAEARASITDWALRLPPEQRRMDNAYIAANTASVVSSVYADSAYKFGCSFIRSLHGPKTSGSKSYERVSCMGEDCPFVKPDREPETVHELHLSDIGNPDYIDKPVRVSLRIAGRVEQPFIVPRRIVLKAQGDECERGTCALHAAGGRMTKDFSNDLRMLIAMSAVPDATQDVIIKKKLAVNNCKNFTYEPTDFMKIVELAAVPKAESAVGHKGESLSDGKYTYQRAYALGDETDFPINAYYEVSGRVLAHPKNQHATLFITSAVPLQDVIEDFDLESSLPLFSPYDSAVSDAALLGHLLSDLSVNVAKVAGRRLALLGLLMTMHAPLFLDVDNERYGGWMQTLIVGDTGEAKSQLVERIMRHTQLGELLSAQNAGRTGLLYTIINKDAMMNFIQWGAFVLNDRRLLVIDEGSGLEKNEYAELRNARRDGVFKVTRSVIGEAQTRTRLVVLSNPRYGKNMRDFPNGIEAVTHLFENADIRRFDLVIGFRNGAVSHDSIDAELSEKVDHLFTSEVLRANMLWAWSRKPEDVVWSDPVREAVKGCARRLNKTYEGSGIHLLSQDAVEKVARMAQALAATLHSTDRTHTKIVVKVAHVVLVEEMLDKLYSAPDLEFDSYVRQNRESESTDYAALGDKIEAAMTALGIKTQEVLSLFGRSRTVNNFALEAISGEPKLARAVAREMFNLQLIKPGRNGYDRTPMFNEFLRLWHRSTAIL